MGVLLDTNVLSELRKGSRADTNVRAWVEKVAREPQWISVLSLGEIRQGIERIRLKDPAQADVLEAWLNTLEREYPETILPVCGRVAAEWGWLNGRRTRPVIDGLLIATARVHGLRIATRNVKDFVDAGVGLENPFAGGDAGDPF